MLLMQFWIIKDSLSIHEMCLNCGEITTFLTEFNDAYWLYDSTNKKKEFTKKSQDKKRMHV